MTIPKKIKALSNKIGLGKSMSPPLVDCRVWAEEHYQEIIEILNEVRKNDIQKYIDGESSLLPQYLRKRLNDFLISNEKIK